MAKDQSKTTAKNGLFKKGNPGRKKGIPNKTTTAAKEAFALAFEGMGGVPKLIEWGKKNPGDFFKLYSRLIPVDLTSGEKAIDRTIIERVVVRG